MRRAAAPLLLLLAARAAAGVTGTRCDPAKFDRGVAYNVTVLSSVDLDTFASPLNTNSSAAGKEAFCCKYCARDSRCNSWTLYHERVCTIHAGTPDARVHDPGAVSGSPLPRIPDVPSDPEGSLTCLASLANRGPYLVRKHIHGADPDGQHRCTPCWKPEPEGARYLITYPNVSKPYHTFPWYVWLPAEGQSPAKYDGALEHIASHGYVVISPYIDYTRCHSKLCSGTRDAMGAVYHNDSYPPRQAFSCDPEGRCVPATNSTMGYPDAASCEQACGLIVPARPYPDTSCTVEQVFRGEATVAYASRHGARRIAVGGASATAPQVLKVATHLNEALQELVGAVVLQHPSHQESHTASLEKAMERYARRAAAGLPLPAVLGVSGDMCARLADCAPLLYDAPCRAAAAETPPNRTVLGDCGDCSAGAGAPVAWREYVSAYAAAVNGSAPAASVSGPWHHWAPQNAGEVPTRRGCGGEALLPETPAVVAWLDFALKGDRGALTALRRCDATSASSGADAWLLPRLDEDRFRNTPAGALVDAARRAHGVPLVVPACGIRAGRVAARVAVNFTGPARPPFPGTATATVAATATATGTSSRTAWAPPPEPGPSGAIVAVAVVLTAAGAGAGLAAKAGAGRCAAGGRAAPSAADADDVALARMRRVCSAPLLAVGEVHVDDPSAPCADGDDDAPLLGRDAEAGAADLVAVVDRTFTKFEKRLLLQRVEALAAAGAVASGLRVGVSHRKRGGAYARDPYPSPRRVAVRSAVYSACHTAVVPAAGIAGELVSAATVTPDGHFFRFAPGVLLSLVQKQLIVALYLKKVQVGNRKHRTAVTLMDDAFDAEQQGAVFATT